ncbi:MAG: GNAT family N-acetyltransferase [Phenylobacterium sp.]|uniref:GNAT family N-acetyltransferase n=1 Tax=Phenylobacterium sp. TaxID=1871053 RepID=UPI003918A197
MTPEEVEAIERATIAAVSPRAVREIGGWIVALDAGTIRRAASAAPLRHDLIADPAVLDAIEAAFASEGLRPAVRLCDAPALESVRAELLRRGYRSEQPTLVKTAAVADMRAVSRAAPADMLHRPDEAWASVFTGEGFDPIDGAHRVAALSRSADAAYGAVREGGTTLAVGVAAFGHGWASVHGMRTSKARRGEGLAGRVLAGLAEACAARDVAKVFLQVEEANAPARALYRRAGFRPVWRYFYWSKG